MQQLWSDDYDQDSPIPSPLSIGGDYFEIISNLGHGVFGVVYQVRNILSGEVFALKDVKVSDQTYVQREIETLRTARSTNVVEIIDADFCMFRQNLHALILMEYLSGGNLNDRLARPSNRMVDLKWMEQISDALGFLHSINIVHRDLKGDNILLTASEDAKIGDFGLARFVPDGEDGWLQQYAHYYMTSDVGPIHSMAPEVFSLHYTEKADIFSLGIVFFAILGRDFIVYKGKRRYGTFVQTEEEKVGLGYAMAKYDPSLEPDMSLLAHCSGALQRIIRETHEFEPNDRPSADEVRSCIESIAMALAVRQNDEECCNI